MSDLAGDAEKSPQNKIALRARLLTARRSLSDAELASSAAKIHSNTLSLVRDLAPSTIAAYSPVGTEPGGPGLPGLVAAALPPGGRLLLPVLLPDNDLDWARFDGSLDSGPRGLREPGGPRLGAGAIREADLVLVPALAVGPGGVRMGRGGGSYDRVLARLGDPGPFTVALLHDGELVDEVPAEPHDRAVRGVITPTGGLVTFS
ncbi:putative 5-formyltetrahydrofolate cyclo-ligase [Actinoplanes missouriensis 431]|uniref:5-formyltetrahydrofolate cyclo-ligase n=1 Tax=Actinoplanes missouriensis (strain ATCC 14538 / DSM 43046 / CBS 188.64 / JCM 3121 / NBRC 102363 / NCIMB 12654 / NRRL B-3342 / UNCC 431) TaxID=512565 RepID=I0HIB6_ACTM4|nr:5-formyltetrahydrofolate cyclo-ligase [Actinoplanes missouriensis]BAL92753.1 putative 5-formyltetrahydrofolate cyclo-ligase [Actinoplanes missouriensis 431]